MSEQTEPRKLRFSPPSHQSLYLELLFDDQKLSTGTGFVVFASSGPVLLTNRHIVTGKNNITDEHLDKENLSEPNQVRIWHSAYEEDSNEVPIRWTSRVEPLRTEDNDPLWREHPTLGPKGDFVALPLTQHAHTSLFPYGLKPGMPTIIEEHEILNNVDIRVGAGSIVSVVGFPFGLTGAGSLGGAYRSG